MNKLLVLLFLIYIAFNQFLINGYDSTNSRLQVSMDNLMSACNISKEKQDMNDRYE